MSTDYKAVIEIGTNSVKLLVAQATGRSVLTLRSAQEVTRLGQEMGNGRRLRPEAIERTVAAVEDFTRQARECRPVSIRIITTCAGREAANQEDLLTGVEQRTGHKVEVVSGEQEAEWAFRGVLSHPAFARQPLLIADMGGGSTEFIVGEDAEVLHWRSLPLGTLRLLDLLKPQDPPTPADLAECQSWLADFIAYEVAPDLANALKRVRGEVRLVGVGGTALALTAVCTAPPTTEREDMVAGIDAERLRFLVNRLWSLSLSERRSLPGLPSKRADTVLTGAVAYAEIMRRFGFNEMSVSRRGVRYGAILDTPRHSHTSPAQRSSLHQMELGLTVPAPAGLARPSLQSQPSL